MSFWQAAAILAGCSIGVGVLLLLVVFCLKFRRARQPGWTALGASPNRDAARLNAPQAAGQRDKAEESPARVRQDAAALVRQLEEAAERIDRRIDARLGELSKLLAQAEAAAADLDGRLRHIHRPAPDTEGAPGGTYQHEEAGLPTGQAALRHAHVMSLKEQGLDALEISRRTGMNLGEVQLVLNLHAGGSPKPDTLGLGVPQP